MLSELNKETNASVIDSENSETVKVLAVIDRNTKSNYPSIERTQYLWSKDIVYRGNLTDSRFYQYNPTQRVGNLTQPEGDVSKGFIASVFAIIGLIGASPVIYDISQQLLGRMP